jgi:hypothetical protein
MIDVKTISDLGKGRRDLRPMVKGRKALHRKPQRIHQQQSPG